MILFYTLGGIYFAAIIIHAFFKLVIDDKDIVIAKLKRSLDMPFIDFGLVTRHEVQLMKHECSMVISDQLVHYNYFGEEKVMEFVKRDLLRKLGDSIMQGAEIKLKTEQDALMRFEDWPHPHGTTVMTATIFVSNHKQNDNN